MATTKPRITITLEPDEYAILARLAALQGSPMARIVSELLSEVTPTLKGLCDTLEAAKRADARVKAQMRQSMEAAEADLMPVAKMVLDQADMFQEALIAALNTVADGTGAGAGTGGALRATPGAAADPGPRSVITGATNPTPLPRTGVTKGKKVHHLGGK